MNIMNICVESPPAALVLHSSAHMSILHLLAVAVLKNSRIHHQEDWCFQKFFLGWRLQVICCDTKGTETPNCFIGIFICALCSLCLLLKKLV